MVGTIDLWRSVPPLMLMQLIVLLTDMLFAQTALWRPCTCAGSIPSAK
jgi:hypothetical protein